MADARNPAPYRKTLFDRMGPDAGQVIRAAAFGLMAFGLAIPMFSAAAAKMQLGPLGAMAFVVGCSLGTGAVAGGAGLALGNSAGWWWKRFMVEGSSTPYVEQYSYQQALVMQGKVAEALESFEAIVAERPDAVQARVRAADLYAHNANRPDRAAELFREAQRIPSIGVGDDIYVTNRLVDLYTGPLATPGRAMVELRRLIDRYPGSAAAVNARTVLAAMKEGMREGSG